jgi:hypothetical protein
MVQVSVLFLAKGHPSERNPAYNRLSIALAQQVHRLGLRRSAIQIFNSTREILRKENVQLPEEEEVDFHIRYAEVLGGVDSEERYFKISTSVSSLNPPSNSAKCYSQAQRIASLLPDPDKNELPRKAQIVHRVSLIERAALAWTAFAAITDANVSPPTDLECKFTDHAL